MVNLVSTVNYTLDYIDKIEKEYCDTGNGIYNDYVDLMHLKLDYINLRMKLTACGY